MLASLSLNDGHFSNIKKFIDKLITFISQTRTYETVFFEKLEQAYTHAPNHMQNYLPVKAYTALTFPDSLFVKYCSRTLQQSTELLTY